MTKTIGGGPFHPVTALGRFTVDVRLHPDQTVVDRGPYRWVRHPAYTGLIAFFVGFGLALSNWASLAVLALLPTLGLLVRIRRGACAARRAGRGVPALRGRQAAALPRRLIAPDGG